MTLIVWVLLSQCIVMKLVEVVMKLAILAFSFEFLEFFTYAHVRFPEERGSVGDVCAGL